MKLLLIKCMSTVNKINPNNNCIYDTATQIDLIEQANSMIENGGLLLYDGNKLPKDCNSLVLSNYREYIIGKVTRYTGTFIEVEMDDDVYELYSSYNITESWKAGFIILCEFEPLENGVRRIIDPKLQSFALYYKEIENKGDNNMKNVNIKKLNPNAKIPTYGSEFSAGADLYSCIDEPATILPGQTVLFKTGLSMEIPVGYAGLIYARSGLASKKGLAPANKVGVVDSDYRGEVMVALHNHSDKPAKIEPNERIAQLIITPFVTANFIEQEELSDTDRGTGGFGSTGVK